MDLQEAFDAGFEAVKSYVDGQMASVLRRLEDLEARPLARDGIDGTHGKDGVGVAGALIDRNNDLIITLSNGEQKNLGRVVGTDGVDGKSVEIAEVLTVIESEVAKAVSAMPIPRDGSDGTSVTLDDVLPVIEARIEEAVKAIPAPRDGIDGTSVTLEEVEPIIAARIEEAVKAIPTPRDGVDGISITLDDVLPAIEARIDEAVKAIEAPRDGLDGTSVTLEDVLPVIEQGLQKAVEALPKPVDGKDGTSVTIEDVEPLILARIDEVAKSIPAPRDGKDGTNGIGVKSALVDQSGSLILTFTNGETHKVGHVVGEKGEKGKDGLSLEDFDARLLEDGRTIELSFEGREIKHVVELAFPVAIYRGAYQEGKEYEQGDMVTYGGSIWHCNGGELAGQWKGTTTEKPGDGAKAWTLAAKRGRDGKDLRGPELNQDVKVKL